jgi:hypothetical protein
MKPEKPQKTTENLSTVMLIYNREMLLDLICSNIKILNIGVNEDSSIPRFLLSCE